MWTTHTKTENVFPHFVSKLLFFGQKLLTFNIELWSGINVFSHRSHPPTMSRSIYSRRWMRDSTGSFDSPYDGPETTAVVTQRLVTKHLTTTADKVQYDNAWVRYVHASVKSERTSLPFERATRYDRWVRSNGTARSRGYKIPRKKIPTWESVDYDSVFNKLSKQLTNCSSRSSKFVFQMKYCRPLSLEIFK